MKVTIKFSKRGTVSKIDLSKIGRDWSRCVARRLRVPQPLRSDRLRIGGSRPHWCLRLLIPSLFLVSDVAWADAQNTPGDSGFTILSNATNVTHWGLGAGVAAAPSPYRGDRAMIMPIPLLSIENKWISVFATTLDLKVGQWSGVTLAMRGRVGILEGYKASDAPILNGMQNRDDITFWYGPTLGWNSELGSLTASYLVGGNKGSQASVEFSKAFESNKWAIEPHADVRWVSDKYVGYYFGVTPSEARVGRSVYDGTSALMTSIGARLSYRIAPSQSVNLDLKVTHLGSGISDSPLVGRRFIPSVSLAYLYQFQ
ncbi:MipA/OmpV family protein [Burkholderia cepacia]|uniref:MipA/OmpV family protein n=1 Tax=Burkholderia cepacia TaxID=292 RepID=UPI000A456A22|nr:MipA/OmpV family protein [Burkholderia cepacia]